MSARRWNERSTELLTLPTDPPQFVHHELAVQPGDGHGVPLNGEVLTRHVSWPLLSGWLLHVAQTGSIKNGRRPSADIEEAHKSTSMCHLGNIAWRVGRTLRFDAGTQTCTGDAEANRLLQRTHRRPFTAAVLEAGIGS